MTPAKYPIGTLGRPWQASDKLAWLERQERQRSYQADVVEQLEGLAELFEVVRYGTLDYQQEAQHSYPLFILQSRNPDPSKPYVLVTGGVHGYETSGVQGALRFAKVDARSYMQHFNLVIAPCVSPWGYETINRWNPHAIDPNRSFVGAGQCGEASQLIAYLTTLDVEFAVHIDLHETTDTDNSEFRPALAAREGTVNTNWNIPDGFYLVADSERLVIEFQRAVVAKVSQVTHIAEADENGQLIGADVIEHGIIKYAAKSLGLCMGLTNARFVTTTEVYPDSPRATPEQCILAQVAAIQGGLDLIKEM